MKPWISVITLGVKDLKKSVNFYRDWLWFSTKWIIGEEFEYGAVAFFDMQNWLKLALWSQESISKDTWIPISLVSSTNFTLWHNVKRQQEVDSIMLLAKRAGANIIKPAQNTFYGGYAWYFQDLDGHLWEIVYNPSFL
jgi:predicted lactoylglutathione lyase